MKVERTKETNWKPFNVELIIIFTGFAITVDAPRYFFWG